ncbi:MAG: succinyl-diaminopimelate desuccinylase [Gaiellales bacterium]
MSTLAERLAARTLELVDIASESLHEEAIRTHLRALVPTLLEPVFIGDDAALWLPSRRENVPLVVLAGHYDTVPAQGNLPGRLDEDAVHGVGATDMKGGVAVALELVRDIAEGAISPRLDVGLLLFGKEELPPSFNPLPELFENAPELHESALAILLEPTSGAIHAGCVGTLTARVVFTGIAGHAARPWLAENAIDRAVDGLAPIARLDRREATVGGLPFYETVTLTRLEAGIADNVIPDRAVATVNLRYPPDRSPAEAVALLESLVPPDATVEVVGNSPPAAVVSDTPAVRALLTAGATAIEPKQAWTNVSDFTTRGIDAVNFGPGEPPYAHRVDELVRIGMLVHAYETLARFVEAGL